MANILIFRNTPEDLPALVFYSLVSSIMGHWDQPEDTEPQTDAQTKFVHSKSTLMIGTTDNPAPIHLELIQLSKVANKNMWDLAWDENAMASKKNLIRALELYPNQTDAHLEKGIAKTYG